MRMSVFLLVVFAAATAQLVMSAPPPVCLPGPDDSNPYTSGATASDTADANECACISWEPPIDPTILPCDAWHVVTDSFRDGTYGCLLGATSPFELYGMAAHTDGNYLTVYLNSNHPLAGTPQRFASGGIVNHGDLFISFRPQEPFINGFGKSHFYGIHFQPSSDAKTTRPGLYGNARAASVVLANDGWKTINSYISTIAKFGTSSVCPSAPVAPGEAGFGNATANYWPTSKPAYTSISSGTLLNVPITYLVFPEDANRPENNPRNHYFYDSNGEIAGNLCDSLSGFVCVTDDLGWPSRATSLGFVGKYNVGIRFPLTAFGVYATQLVSNFRISYAFECGNDLVALDGNLVC